MPVVLGIAAALALMLLLPFSILSFVSSWAVSIHEVWHGLAAMFTGGSIASLDVQWEHGLAMTQGGWYPIVSMAGYVGTAIVGAMFFLASVHVWARWLGLAFLAVASVLLCVHAHFSGAFFFALLANAVVGGCLFLDRKGTSASFFATLLIYPQWRDVQQLLWYQPGSTDAGLLAQHVGLPWLTWPIALIYTLGTVFVWFWALRYLLRRSSAQRANRKTPLVPSAQ